MDRLFKQISLGKLKLANGFVFPPIKTAYGTPGGEVTKRQLAFYKQIAKNGPGLLILEPAAVTVDGREHPKQLCIHLPESSAELKKIVHVIHKEDRLACLHLNHAGGGAKPKASGSTPKAPSPFTCPSTGQTSDTLTQSEIDTILAGYQAAAQKAVDAGFDAIEIQAGHGYLVSQFLNGKINKREDDYGKDRLYFAKQVLAKVKAGAPDMTIFVRISGSEMSPEYGITPEDLKPFISLAEKSGVAAIHVGMGSSCFAPPWYFHHASLPRKPQMDALAWIRKQTQLPIIAAGRMGRREAISETLDKNLADLVALGRPLIADPDLIDKWRQKLYDDANYCGYCLQGCLHRLKNGQPLGCNLNPQIGMPELTPSPKPLTVLIAGGGPAGMSAAVYLSKRGHHVTLVEAAHTLGGQFNLAWQAPGKQTMQQGLEHLEAQARSIADKIITGKRLDADLVEKIRPDLLVWATGAVQNIPEINGLEDQYQMTSLEFFSGEKLVNGPRVLVIGAGRTGLEIAEKLGSQGFEVTATKRTDPIGSMMEMITKKLALMRMGKMPKVTLMPHTTVKHFNTDGVEMTQDAKRVVLKPFQTVILASGMLSAQAPEKNLYDTVAEVEIIGDAHGVNDIYTAVHEGYALAQKY